MSSDKLKSTQQQIIPVQYIPYPQEEDEIDLRELLKTILNHKKFIIFFTLFVTLLAVIYVLVKTPVWEVDTNIKVPMIENKPLSDSQEISQYLSLKYKNEIEKKFKLPPNAWLSSVKSSKKSKLFVSLSVMGLNNKYANEKTTSIVKGLKEIYKPQIEAYMLQKKNEIQNLDHNLTSIKEIEISNIKMKIKNIKIEQTQQDNLIKFYKNQVENISQKIEYLEKTLKKYNLYLQQLIENNKNNKDVASKLLVSNQILSYQNLITQLNNQIRDLSLKKDNIITNTIPTLRSKKELLTQKITKIQKELELNIPQKIKNIKDKIQQDKLKLGSIQNVKIISSLSYDKPVKPKKKLIVIVAFITGLILSIFLVFFMEFMRSFKEEK